MDAEHDVDDLVVAKSVTFLCRVPLRVEECMEAVEPRPSRPPPDTDVGPWIVRTVHADDGVVMQHGNPSEVSDSPRRRRWTALLAISARVIGTLWFLRVAYVVAIDLWEKVGSDDCTGSRLTALLAMLLAAGVTQAGLTASWPMRRSVWWPVLATLALVPDVAAFRTTPGWDLCRGFEVTVNLAGWSGLILGGGLALTAWISWRRGRSDRSSANRASSTNAPVVALAVGGLLVSWSVVQMFTAQPSMQWRVPDCGTAWSPRTLRLVDIPTVAESNRADVEAERRLFPGQTDYVEEPINPAEDAATRRGWLHKARRYCHDQIFDARRNVASAAGVGLGLTVIGGAGMTRLRRQGTTTSPTPDDPATAAGPPTRPR